ncbi:MAG: acyl-CoA thioesterase [Caenispirillum bisanense]|uniref:(3S)-malyl-CoA thioesterase n=1 Tax=Caenispirillum bisanense TaxID=414052 RepID=A0A286GHI4_9PROT|nr:acyl-CoA thioesterase [Caenispirillum bisanense]MCA1940065.1 acyl-CoA thioesterase [Caenispirillum bisanense]MCA1972323.1 acyl-CoA thioesterase [Caenispirillum sp.]SOD94997.1 (3S)-malyl-CoA thioesterase [Caenispirillum bisanense]
MSADHETPQGEIMIRTLAMPADTNPAGDIFGGWLMSQMDLAGGMAAGHRADGRVATVAADRMTFHRPVRVGDELTCYTRVTRVGRTSLAVAIEAWVRRRGNGQLEKVTEGTFTFVAIDENGRPREVPPARA